MAPRWIAKTVEETGFTTLLNSSNDTKILILQRLIRHAAYSSSTLILAAFLAECGLSNTSIGLFMTLTLVGDMLISLVLTIIADGVGRRYILMIGAALMTLSGVVFAVTSNYWFLLASATIGVVTPSGNEIGPFRAIEESIIAHLTEEKERGSIFAWYTLVGNVGMAIGNVVAGWVTTGLMHDGWTKMGSYRIVFLIYAGLGFIKLVTAFLLSPACEADTPESKSEEAIPLTSEDEPVKTEVKLLPSLSQESKVVLIQLCLLMGLDSFASGLAAKSWLTYYFTETFAVLDSTLGMLFFVSSVISAISVLVAASIAKRIGNVRAMVYTHLPSAVFLALIGIPSEMWLAMLFVLLRSCSQQMDTAPRSAFMAAIILPNERTAVMGTVNTAKTIGQTLGPFLAGLLIDRGLFWFVFMLAGILKAIYDVGMLLMFAQSKQRETATV